ncbi:hypothetical protein WJX72_008464 [[Myrmecia] bisecta]|uniref:Kinesin-like protein n=1 Tax=[Myrmecia] bisecta TaxID=41462 RepID=A0AAW1Q447_9CHLO
MATTKATECVKVVVRCRPLSGAERAEQRRSIVAVDHNEHQVQVHPPTAGEETKTFTFDQVYDGESSQQDVYREAAKPIVDAVLDGYNGTIFAYGQTGCGKTYTMEGSDGNKGVIPNAFQHIFADIANGGAREYLVRASYLEIYNEDIRDLLAATSQHRLQLKESADRGVHVRGLMQFVVKDMAEISSILQVGQKNRSVGATLMNQESSRSHSIFSITVETATRSQSAPGAPIRVGKLNLVDLAGSERQSKTGATGDRLKEATKINLSLSALGNVISALVDPRSSHIPYRDSKLTRLLQDSLGGNTKTVMIAHVGPADYNFEETLSTLRYANRAKNIANKPRVNEDPKDTMLREFQDEIAQLKLQLQATEQPAKVTQMEKVVEVPASEAVLARLREAMREDVEAAVRAAVSSSALEAAREEAGRAARAHLEAALAQAAVGQEEAARAYAQLARHQADLACYAAQIQSQQQERSLLERKLAALESKVLCGGANMLEVVEALEEQAAKAEAALAAQQARENENEGRLAGLAEARRALEQRWASVAEEVAGKRAQTLTAYTADLTVPAGCKPITA